MTAATVTGLFNNGEGSSQKSGLKGPSNGRNFFVPQLCPHVVMCGKVDTAAPVQGVAIATVTFPNPLPKGQAYYEVIVTPLSESNHSSPPNVIRWIVTKHETDGHFDYFTVTCNILEGDLPAVFMYEVLTAGLGLDVNTDNPDTP